MEGRHQRDPREVCTMRLWALEGTKLLQRSWWAWKSLGCYQESLCNSKASFLFSYLDWRTSSHQVEQIFKVLWGCEVNWCSEPQSSIGRSSLYSSQFWWRLSWGQSFESNLSLWIYGDACEACIVKVHQRVKDRNELFWGIEEVHWARSSVALCHASMARIQGQGAVD